MNIFICHTFHMMRCICVYICVLCVWRCGNCSAWNKCNNCHSISGIWALLFTSNCNKYIRLPGIIYRRVILTHWDRVTQICVNKQYSRIGLDNGLSLGWRQTISWTNAGILFIGHLRTNYVKFQSKFKRFYSWKCICECRLENGGHFVSASMC